MINIKNSKFFFLPLFYSITQYFSLLFHLILIIENDILAKFIYIISLDDIIFNTFANFFNNYYIKN
ncbi:hypothetical protein KUTeg_002337 [Tegillarca granosa]|uniref:Uncharacterized protein n=1 Tax=Tegillarca granosa TaxID=220873 RepID=A0ABQ9FU54_TEGGR|nr:hypothetical protein KUTeg_002337 [Tegillarca granosa]